MSFQPHLPQGRPDEPGAAPPQLPLYTLVYCSRASATLDDAGLASLLRSARHHNAMWGITGILVMGGGLFFQWLEGPRPLVQRLLQRLKADTRHSQLVVLSSEEEVRERLFPGWAMERVDAAAVREVLADALGAARSAPQAQALQRLLDELDGGRLRALNDR